MNITFLKAKQLIAAGTCYTIFPSYCPYRTVDAVDGALCDGFIEDLVIDLTEDYDDEEEYLGDSIEIIVSTRQCETWEDRETRLVG